jgi:hypothetical protein
LTQYDIIYNIMGRILAGAAVIASLTGGPAVSPETAFAQMPVTPASVELHPSPPTAPKEAGDSSVESKLSENDKHVLPYPERLLILGGVLALFAGGIAVSQALSRRSPK